MPYTCAEKEAHWFLKIGLAILFEKERQISYPLIFSANAGNSCAWARLRLGARNYMEVLRVGDRDHLLPAGIHTDPELSSLCGLQFNC